MKTLNKISKHLGSIVTETHITGRRYISNTHVKSGLWTGVKRYAH